ncbi:MAG: hypothetical protein MSH30_08270 [Campylobacter sp.]|nr:hypothetical protein [Campylobacter sp.]
MIELIFVIVIL